MRSRIRADALAGEAISAILQRPTRTALTMLGTVLGVGTFVAVLGLTASATGQISKRFTALAATEVVVEDLANDQDIADAPADRINPDGRSNFPPDADRRAERIDGVVNAGVYWTVAPQVIGEITGVPLPGELGKVAPVVAASPGYLRAIQPMMRSGRSFDRGHHERADRVAVLGDGIASALGIGSIEHQPAVLIGGTPFTVIGVIGQVQRHHETRLQVIVPSNTVEATWPLRPRAGEVQRMLVETRLGAAGVVGAQLPVAIRPDRPDSFRVITPPDPRTLRQAVDTDLGSLFLVLSCVCLVIGAVGIANTTLVAVMERQHEIGLRRALGALPRHIAAQFLIESALLGGLGGILGASVGVATVVAVALVRQWTPITAPWTVAAAPVAGALIGLLAGLYPALRAARVEPANALRR